MTAPGVPWYLAAWRGMEKRADLALQHRTRVRPGGGPAGAPARMLIARCDLIGDYLLFTGTLRSYREAFPDTRLVLLVRDHVAELAFECPWVDEVWVLPNRRFRLSPAERIRWWRRMGSAGFDAALNTVYGTSWEHLDPLVGWTGAPRRVAHQCLDDHAPRPAAGPFFTELVPARGRSRFTVERDLDMVEHLTGRRPPLRMPELRVRPEWRAAASRHAGPGPYGVVSPGARYAIKRWGAANFAAALARAENGLGLRWCVAGAAGESDLCADLTARLARKGIAASNLSGRLSLGPLAALIESAAIHFGNDSAPAHLAAAVGTPGVAIVGGGHPGVCYPYPGNPLTRAVCHDLPCGHCSWYCTMPENECITRITPGEAADALTEVRGLHSGRTGGAG